MQDIRCSIETSSIACMLSARVPSHALTGLMLPAAAAAQLMAAAGGNAELINALKVGPSAACHLSGWLLAHGATF